MNEILRIFRKLDSRKSLHFDCVGEFDLDVMTVVQIPGAIFLFAEMGIY